MARHWLRASLVLVALVGLTRPALAYPTELLVDSGPSANRLDLVILGDGYRAEDQAQLTNDALAVLETLFSDPLWQRHRAYVNVKLVHVESNQTGADYGTHGGLRDTALGANYFCYDIERLLCADSAAVFAVTSADAPEFDQILVLVNDTKYGGGGGPFSTISIAPGAGEVAVHEIGHSLFQLADEYSDPYPAYPLCDPARDCAEPNATLRTSREDLKWHHWIEHSTPLPTPDEFTYDQAIGAFEGARYHYTGVYRPARNCKMRTLGVPFCSVCAQAGVLAFHTFTEPIDALLPAGEVRLGAGQRQLFQVVGPRHSNDTLTYAWSLDGALLASNGLGSFELDATPVAPGAHTLTVDVFDSTPLVRHDPEDLLTSSRSWSVVVEGSSDSATRIDSGSSGSYVDRLGRTWAADAHASDGVVFDRGAIAIAGTEDDRLYQTERHALTRYAIPVSNGDYEVRLHFAETYERIRARGQRLFGVRVENARTQYVDVFARAGGRNRALVLTQGVTVRDGSLDVRFTKIVQNTLINAIEVVPVVAGTPAAAGSSPAQ